MIPVRIQKINRATLGEKEKSADGNFCLKSPKNWRMSQVASTTVEYETISVNEYEKKYEEQQVKYFKKKAAKFGFQLVPA